MEKFKSKIIKNKYLNTGTSLACNQFSINIFKTSKDILNQLKTFFST